MAWPSPETNAIFVPNGSPAAGLIIHTTAFHARRNDGGLFTKHIWHPDLSKAPANQLGTVATPKPAAPAVPAAPAIPAPVIPAPAAGFSREACIQAIVAKQPAYQGMDWAPHSDDVLKATLASL